MKKIGLIGGTGDVVRKMEIKRLSLADKELITEYIINELCVKTEAQGKGFGPKYE